MTSKEKQEKLDSLRAKAKDAQAELGYIALTRENLDARWAELKQLLKDGEREFVALQEKKAEDEAVEHSEVRA